MKDVLIASAVLCSLAACSDVEVQSVSPTTAIKVVYIQTNPAADATAPDLVPAIENGFQRHNIGTKVITGEPPSDKDYCVTYTATGGWDLKPFLKAADIRLKQGFKQVGYAHYQAGGGLSVSKFDQTRDKMIPVMDQLLGGSQQR